jgi:hypothetical protein
MIIASTIPCSSGHLDTVAVGVDALYASALASGDDSTSYFPTRSAFVMCSTLGLYCGPQWGWNVFTRKTTHCLDVSCKSCQIVYRPDVDFTHVTCRDLTVRYPPAWGIVSLPFPAAAAPSSSHSSAPCTLLCATQPSRGHALPLGWHRQLQTYICR